MAKDRFPEYYSLLHLAAAIGSSRARLLYEPKSAWGKPAKRQGTENEIKTWFYTGMGSLRFLNNLLDRLVEL